MKIVFSILLTTTLIMLFPTGSRADRCTDAFVKAYGISSQAEEKFSSREWHRAVEYSKKAAKAWRHAADVCDSRNSSTAVNHEKNHLINLKSAEEFIRIQKCESSWAEAARLENQVEQAFKNRQWQEGISRVESATAAWEQAARYCGGNNRDVAESHVKQQKKNLKTARQKVAETVCREKYNHAVSRTRQAQSATAGQNWEAAFEEYRSAVQYWKDVASECSGINQENARTQAGVHGKNLETARTNLYLEKCLEYSSLATRQGDEAKALYSDRKWKEAYEAYSGAAITWQNAAEYCVGEKAGIAESMYKNSNAMALKAKCEEKNQLAGSTSKLAEALFEAGKWKEAADTYDKAKELWMEAVQDCPGTMAFWPKASYSKITKKAAMARCEEKIRQAEELGRKAVSIFRGKKPDSAETYYKKALAVLPGTGCLETQKKRIVDLEKTYNQTLADIKCSRLNREIDLLSENIRTEILNGTGKDSFYIDKLHRNRKKAAEFCSDLSGETSLFSRFEETTLPLISTVKKRTKTPMTIAGLEFVWIPGACYKMGQTESEKSYLIKQKGKSHYTKMYTDELPRHEVCLNGFWMGKTEITRGQFKVFVKATGYKTEAEKNDGSYIINKGTGWKWKKMKGYNWQKTGSKQTDSYPVTCVSWNDAQAFIKWLNKKSGFEFFLPTEAQWEYAARSGTTGMRYWGSDNKACSYENLVDKGSNWSDSFPCSDGYKLSAPAGSYKANRFGIYDMLGNVSEWCRDVYVKNAYSQHGRENPVITSDSTFHVRRGGSYVYELASIRASHRYGSSASYSSSVIGFRVSFNKSFNPE